MAGDCTCGGGDCTSSATGGGSSTGCNGSSSQYASCGTCGGNCSGANCGAGCGSACGGCGNSCDGCSGGCGTSCNVACSVSCSSSCTGGCYSECGSQCTGKTQATNFAKLKLEKKFMANNIKFISDFVNYEVSRRDKTPETITFAQKERLDDSKVNKIVSNLEKVGSKLSVDVAMYKKRGLRTFAEDIIAKATVLYKTDYQNS